MRHLRRITYWLVCLSVIACGCNRAADMAEMAPLAVGKSVPPIEATGWLNLHGAPPTAAELAGKVVVIDCWAHWCGPCREDLPRMAQIYTRFRDQGVVFIGLTGEGEEAIAETKAAVAEANVPWANGYGALETLTALEVKVLPTKIVVGRDGRVLWHNYLPGDLEDEISKAIDSGA